MNFNDLIFKLFFILFFQVRRRDMDLWAEVLNDENQYRRPLIDQVKNFQIKNILQKFFKLIFF